MLRIESSKKARARRQAGFVVTVELLLITVILVVGLVTGMTKVRDQVLSELDDTGGAVGAINQTYGIVGTVWDNANGDRIAEAAGWSFQDETDPDGSLAVGGDATNVLYLNAPVPTTSEANTNENLPLSLSVAP